MKNLKGYRMAPLEEASPQQESLNLGHSTQSIWTLLLTIPSMIQM